MYCDRLSVEDMQIVSFEVFLFEFNECLVFDGKFLFHGLIHGLMLQLCHRQCQCSLRLRIITITLFLFHVVAVAIMLSDVMMSHKWTFWC